MSREEGLPKLRALPAFQKSVIATTALTDEQDARRQERLARVAKIKASDLYWFRDPTAMP